MQSLTVTRDMIASKQMAATIGISISYLFVAVCIFLLDIFAAAYFNVDYSLSFVRFNFI